MTLTLSLSALLNKAIPSFRNSVFWFFTRRSCCEVGTGVELGSTAGGAVS